MTRQKRSRHRLKRTVAPYLYLSPSLVIIGLLMLLPMVTVISYSFQNSAVLR
ncbi:MAG: sugar ABC transporter permease, partial [Mesorhizobium sp.]